MRGIEPQGKPIKVGTVDDTVLTEVISTQVVAAAIATAHERYLHITDRRGLKDLILPVRPLTEAFRIIVPRPPPFVDINLIDDRGVFRSV